jgi:quercetin 2,3-dioxygenase
MLTLRKATDRGHANHGWLDTHHTFSFADYRDQRFMGFGPLRVINDDVIAPGAGFPPHPHRDMEIVTYILDGALQHKDSMGNGSVIRPGDVQRMSAGTGVVHSEFNASKDAPCHLLQIWILPNREGTPTGYEQKAFSEAERRGKLRLVASPDGAEGSVELQQDARVYASLLGAGQAVRHMVAKGRKGWLHLAKGAAEVNGEALQGGDGLAIDGEEQLAISSSSNAELLLFDMAG